MKFLFVHQNFPGQYKHLAAALADDSRNQVVAIGEKGNLGRLRHPKVTEVSYEKPRGASSGTHHYVRGIETAVRRGQAVVRVAIALRRNGFVPDVICCHPGWGEGLYLADVWPNSKRLYFFEFYHHAQGFDCGFDPEFPQEFDEVFKIRTRNAVMLLSLAAADWGLVPTRWQRSSLPEEFQPKISQIHDGIDTEVVRPNPDTELFFKSGLKLAKSDEVITFVNRNLEPYRGYHSFMRALPEIMRRRKNAHVVIVGGNEVSYGRRLPDGKTYKEMYLEEVRDQLDISRLHFLGRVPYSQFVELLQVSSVHVYLTYPFVLSWSMLEAMSAECLVVGSRTPPVEEVITDGENGLLVDFFKPLEIADAVDRVLDHPDRMQAIREQARKHIVEHYDLKTKCLPKHIKLVKTLAMGKRPRVQAA
jgi:glycosyltransferase involved in cell wall biosynthesis